MSAGQVVGPVHDVEAGEGQGEDDPGYDVDALGFGEGPITDGGLEKSQSNQCQGPMYCFIKFFLGLD